MFGRLMVAVAAVLLVAGMAALPELANPAAGAPAATRVGTVFPSTLTPGGTARFCGAGFAPGAAVDVLVGDDSAQAVTATRDGGFCLDLRAMTGADAPAQLLAVGKMADGGLLKVSGKAAIKASDALTGSAAPAVGPLTASSDLIVLGLWAAAAGLAVLVGLVGIAAQRRRHAPVAIGVPAQE